MQNDRMTNQTRRRLGTVVALVLAATFMLAGHGIAAPKPNHGGQDIVATTQNYLTTFYPLWFTHAQFQIAPKNELVGPEKISPLYQAVVAINDDTLYASSPIDVIGCTVGVFVPETVAG